jgi:serine/threonine-protein kinase
MGAPSVVFLSSGTLFHDRYRVLRGIKAGAMGAVHEARDERTNSLCALKVMLPGVLEDAILRDRFAQEAKITGEIRSDHVVRVTDAGVDAVTGMPFLVMELLHGEELGALLKKRGHIPIDEALLYLSQVALALDKAHAQGIVHRDLKPGNLFIAQRDDGSPCVKILDFGIAKLVSEGAHTHSTQAVGTPTYMAPEQIIGNSRDIGPCTDIHALGHIVYAMLTGEAYWQEEAREIGVYALIKRVVDGPVELPTVRALRRRGMTLPPWFDGWFARATALHPQDRFARATEAIADLREQYHESGPDSFRMNHTIPLVKRSGSSEKTGNTGTLDRPLEDASTTRAPTAMVHAVSVPAPPLKPRWRLVGLAALGGLVVTIGVGLMFIWPKEPPKAAAASSVAPLPPPPPPATAAALPSSGSVDPAQPVEVAAPVVSSAPLGAAPAATTPRPGASSVGSGGFGTKKGNTKPGKTEEPPGTID